MTIDISALAWMVRRMDVSATLKTFVAVFAIFIVLYYLGAIFQIVSGVLRDDFGISDSGGTGWLVLAITMSVIAAFSPLTFILWDWVARRPWRYLAAFNGAFLGAISMAVIGGALGIVGNEIFENLESFDITERISLIAMLGVPLAILIVWLLAESRTIQVVMKWLVISMAAVVLIGLAGLLAEDLSFDSRDALLEAVLTLAAPVAYASIAIWLVVRIIRHRIILSADRPRELILGALYRKSFWARLAFLTGLPSSLWHAAALKTPAFWAFLFARPMVYGGFLYLVRNVDQYSEATTQIAGGAGLIAGGHALFYGAKRLATKYAWVPENPGDPRAPVLFLRSFEDDQLTFKRPWWDLPGHWFDLWSFRRNADEAMIDEIAQYGPVVALGMPGEKTIPFGAQRYYSTHEDWQNIVANTAKAAQAIVIAAGSTPGVLWEYELIARENLFDRTLVLFPPLPGDESEGNTKVLAALASAFRVSNQFELAKNQHIIAMIPTASGAPTLLTARKVTAAAYIVAMRGHFQKCTARQLADSLSL
jgi:hypothetical protein